MLALDQWIQQGLLKDKQSAQFGLGQQQASNGDTSIVQFVFSPQPGAALAGALVESRDSAGRKYPLIIAAEPDEPLNDPSRVARIPVEMFGFLGYATYHLSSTVSGGLGVEHLHNGLQAEPAEFVPSAASTLSEMCSSLWGSFDAPAKYVTFGSLYRVLSPLRGRMPPRMSFGIRYPIRGEPTLAATDVAFWLKLSAALTGDADFQPVCFWRPHVEEAKSWLIAYLRPGPPIAASTLFKGAENDDDIFDLETSMADSADDLRAILPPSFGRLLDEEDLRLETIDSRMRAIVADM